MWGVLPLFSETRILEETTVRRNVYLHNGNYNTERIQITHNPQNNGINPLTAQLIHAMIKGK
jgi:hypothetical protein